jgi:hypothetical protein
LRKPDDASASGLSVTFPFNISLGIPLSYGVISRLWA